MSITGFENAVLKVLKDEKWNYSPENLGKCLQTATMAVPFINSEQYIVDLQRKDLARQKIRQCNGGIELIEIEESFLISQGQ